METYVLEHTLDHIVNKDDVYSITITIMHIVRDFFDVLIPFTSMNNKLKNCFWKYLNYCNICHVQFNTLFYTIVS